MFQHHPARNRITEKPETPAGSGSFISQHLPEPGQKRSVDVSQHLMKTANQAPAKAPQPIHETLMDRLQEMNVLRRIPTQGRSIARVESILRAATDLCVDACVDSLTTAAVSEKLQIPIGTIYQFFENRQAILRGVAVRTNFMVDQVIRTELTDFQPDAEWFSLAAKAIDRSIDVFLEQENLVPVIRALYHLEVYQEVNRQTLESLVDALMVYLSNIGMEVTAKRRDMAYFALRIGGYCQHMIVLETDPTRRELMREQFKTLGANYLLQALVGTDIRK